ncbi:Hypothetical predicted protein, partial [Paramuricea clavata]
ADLNGFTSDHIRRLPNSPTQNGTDSILSFYALLPSGSGLLPTSVLATIFTSHQDKILSGVDSELEEPGVSIASTETPALTSTQTQNIVPIIIFNHRSGRVNTLVVVDIRVTVTAKMNLFCFSTHGDQDMVLKKISSKLRLTKQKSFVKTDTFVVAKKRRGNLLLAKNNNLL